MLSEERIIVEKDDKHVSGFDKVKKVIVMGLFVLLGAAFGFCFAMLLDHVDASKTMRASIMVAIFIPSLVVSVFIHIAIHELGHVLMGRLTGYKLISYRLFSFVLTKQDGKWKLKRYTLPGTAGQALMFPPEKKDGQFPWLLYNLGGGLVNIVLALGALVIYLLVPDLSAGFSVVLLCFFLVGLILGITNLVPMPGIMASNDGSNILAMYKDELARECFYKQMKLVGGLSMDKSFKDYPLEYFMMPEEANLKFALIAASKNHELAYYYDVEDYNTAVKLLNEIEHEKGISKIIKFSFDTERLFIECMQGPREEVVERLCTKELLAVMKQAKNTPDMNRILMAYEGLYMKDIAQAKQHYGKALKLLENYPFKGIADLEMRFLNMVKEKLDEIATEEEVAVSEEVSQTRESSEQ